MSTEPESPTPKPAEPGAADPRVPLAAERTLLAWIRTGLAFMGFGFVVARFGLFLREIAQVGPYASAPPVNAASIGIGLVVVGVIVNIGAGLRYRRIGLALERGEAPRIS